MGKDRRNQKVVEFYGGEKKDVGGEDLIEKK